MKQVLCLPSNEVLKKMSAIFNVSTDYLLDNEVATTAPVYHLVNDESRLIDGYRELNADGKNLIMTMISQLNFGRAGQGSNDYLSKAT